LIDLAAEAFVGCPLTHSYIITYFLVVVCAPRPVLMRCMTRSMKGIH